MSICGRERSLESYRLSTPVLFFFEKLSQVFDSPRRVSQTLLSHRKIASLFCWETGNRTPIKGFKGLCPTVRRSPSREEPLQYKSPGAHAQNHSGRQLQALVIRAGIGRGPATRILDAGQP